MTSEGIGSVPNFVEVFQVVLTQHHVTCGAWKLFGADFQKAPNHARETFKSCKAGQLSMYYEA
jgi:hypothetical protein